MESKNRCYTYFYMTGDIDPELVSRWLGLDALHYNNGKASSWDFGLCDEYDVYTTRQMEKTIAPLCDKISELNAIREATDAKFYLAVVPTIYADDIHPCLAPSLAVMDFCHATRTELDIDLYIVDGETEND